MTVMVTAEALLHSVGVIIEAWADACLVPTIRRFKYKDQELNQFDEAAYFALIFLCTHR